MEYFFINLALLALLAGLFALSAYETKRGIRIFANSRTRFDERVTRIEFIFSHVDFSAFIRDLILRIEHRVAHDIVHFSLLTVRAIERFLTRTVRSLRVRHSADIVPHENAREFVRTLSDFKGHLEETRPEVPDVLE